MQCPNGCPSTMQNKREDRIFYRNGEPIVISDLVMYVCPVCAHESMSLSSARIVEDVLNKKIEPSGKFTADLYETSSV